MDPRALLALVLGGCAAHHAVTRADLSAHLERRLGAGVSTTADAAPGLPEGVDTSDGLSMDEAVAVALWNNPDLAVRIADLGLARADLLTAGKLANPVLTGLIPLDPRQWQAALALPLDGLWVRPSRVAGARARDEATAQQVVQAAVDLARDVRLAFVQTAAARTRADLLGDLATLESDRRGLLALRVEAGDLSPISLDLAVQQALDATEAARRGEVDAGRSTIGLTATTGYDVDDLTLQTPELPDGPLPALEELKAWAATSRPDLRAAALESEAAAHAVDTAKAAAVAAGLGVHVQGGGASNNGRGLTPTLSVPLFDRNQDGVARALAAREAAQARERAVRARVDREVELAHARLEDARDERRHLQRDLLPALRAASARLELAHTTGDVSGLEALDARLRVARAELAAVDTDAAVLAARIELDRALGGAPPGLPIDASAALHLEGP
ncbi:MAG: TolC family protein [Alphaproteobacteria bacterium]|nr:TolC family protein [Alphaproteobacteria bacterium]